MKFSMKRELFVINFDVIFKTMKFRVIWLIMDENQTWFEWDIIDWMKLLVLHFNCGKIT